MKEKKKITENGKTTEFYEGGSIASVAEVDENGVAHGVCKVYYKNGAQWAVGKNVHGKMDGEWKWWKDDGTIWQTGNFKDSVKHGSWIRYKDGKIEKEMMFSEGKEVKKKK